MLTPEERIDAKLNRVVRARLAEEAAATGRPLNDILNECLALRYGLDPGQHPVARHIGGRGRKKLETQPVDGKQVGKKSRKK